MKKNNNIVLCCFALILMSCSQSIEETISSSKIIPAQVLLNLYFDNQKNADSLFKGKEITISGIVEDISDNYFVLLQDTIPLHGVLCYTPGQNVSSRIRVNDSVFFSGKCYGMLGDNVVIKECKLIR